MNTRADRFFVAQCIFAFGAASVAALPPPHLPEFAMVGRSNVGKSSLFNALVGQKMAHVSKTPGRTQQLNFFLLGRRCYLVDVPGYGYAKAPKEKIDEWQALMYHYLRERRTLQQVFVLIDARLGITETDTPMLEELDRAGRAYRVLLTKCDLLKDAGLAAMKNRVEIALRERPAAWPEVMPTSAAGSLGIDALRKAIFESI